MAPTITFDGPSKVITIGYDGDVTNVDAARIYSAWKEWVLAGNAQYLEAFASSVGGDPLGGGVSLSGYYFIRNDLGWTLEHAPTDFIIQVNGDLYPADPGTPFLELAPDMYTVTWVFQRSAASYVTDIGGAIPTAEDVADAVWDEQLSDHTTSGSAGRQVRNVWQNQW
jgi:hypothetical protein